MANSISSFTQIGGVRPKFSVYIFDVNNPDVVFKKFDSVDECASYFTSTAPIIRQVITKKRAYKDFFISKEDYWMKIDSRLI